MQPSQLAQIGTQQRFSRTLQTANSRGGEDTSFNAIEKDGWRSWSINTFCRKTWIPRSLIGRLTFLRKRQASLAIIEELARIAL